MIQIIEQSHEERVKMYMRCPKKELAEMLANWSEAAERHRALTLRRPLRHPAWRSGHIVQSNT